MHQPTPVQLQIKASKTEGIKAQEEWQNTFSTYNSSFNKRIEAFFFLPLMLVSYEMSVIPHKRYYFHRKNGIPLLTINRFHFQTS